MRNCCIVGRRKLISSLRSWVIMAVCFLFLSMMSYGLISLNALDFKGREPANLMVTPSNFMQNRIEADKVLHELEGYTDHSLDEISENKILNTVHYVWCTNDTFKFRNYVSVMSVWKILRPDIIEFHQRVAPKEDKYDDWLIQINKTIPSFVVKNLPANQNGNDKGCGFWLGLTIVSNRGGIFVGNDVLVTNAMVKHLKDERTIIFSEQTKDNKANIAVAMGTIKDNDFIDLLRKFTKYMKPPVNAKFCETVTTMGSNGQAVPCYIMDEGLKPRDIFNSDMVFGEKIRTIVYGSPEKKVPQQFLPGVIPKIVHYVWFGHKEMNFFMYVSMLSTLFILNPEKVVIHTDGGLHGPLFDKIRKDKRVLIIKREKPFDIFGHKVLYAQHRSDIVRAECLLKYGGIYMDWDVLWLKDPDDVIKTGYDAIANFDHMQQGNFPDTINLGVFMTKPKSTFVKRWQDALINYRSHDFLYNAVQLPYKIYERYPQYLYIEKALQVICFHRKCHPTFHPDYKMAAKMQPFDWRKDVYSIHFTFPDPQELTDEKACKNGTGMFADICRFVVQNEYKLQ